MVTEIRYYSKSGNTKHIAECIAQDLNLEAKPITEPITGDIDLLFLGGAFYFMHPAKELSEFIESLDPNKIKAVAVFSTTGGPEDASKVIGKECRKHGLNVLSDEFHCTSHQAKEEKTEIKVKEFAQKAYKDAQKSA